MIRRPTLAELEEFPLEPHIDPTHLINRAAARVVESDGKALGVFGVLVTSPGVGHVWVAPSEDCEPKHATTMVRAGRELVREAMEQFNLHRLQTTTYADNYQLGKWLGLIGFEPEAVLGMAGPEGEDMTMFRILRRH